VRKIGLIGGMSWQSSARYYELINELVTERLGGFHSAACVMTSVDFAAIEEQQQRGDWRAAGTLLGAEAAAIQAAGAECILLCTNTMHKVADQVVDAISVPFIDLLDVTARAVHATGCGRVGLLGTRYTMEDPFYLERMARHDLEIVVPDADDRRAVNEVIYGELVLGIITDESRQVYRGVLERLVGRGAEGVILGCTEVELLIGSADSSVPVFPTTALHAQAAVEFALTGADG
jgi:aspartate racemase